VGGLGGQGIILCGSIIGKAAAIYSGRHAALIQAFGPEARAVRAARRSSWPTRRLAIPTYDTRHSGAAVTRRLCAVLTTTKPDGLVLYENELVQLGGKLPTTARSFGIPATRFAEDWAGAWCSTS